MITHTILMMAATIHRMTVTEIDGNIAGGVGIGQLLMNKAGLVEHQKVTVSNLSTGAKFSSYVTSGDGEGQAAINGPDAHLVSVGDKITLTAYQHMPREQALSWEPAIVMVDAQNQPVEMEVYASDKDLQEIATTSVGLDHKIA